MAARRLVFRRCRRRSLVGLRQLQLLHIAPTPRCIDCGRPIPADDAAWCRRLRVAILCRVCE